MRMNRWLASCSNKAAFEQTGIPGCLHASFSSTKQDTKQNTNQNTNQRIYLRCSLHRNSSTQLKKRVQIRTGRKKLQFRPSSYRGCTAT